ncbi:MAG: hypothetical protein JWP74_628 [Marmoricola sp.]|nr:hypothetical protein [Marmoricola sp.]
MVGLYGDPGVAWSIVLALDLVDPIATDAVASAATRLVAAHQHLGSAPVPEVYATEVEDDVLARFASNPYGDRDPLLRVALSDDGRSLVVAGHHGAVDGLGLLGAAGLLSGLDLGASARGVGPGSEPSGFLLRSGRRVVEALVHPPARLVGDRQPVGTEGDWLVSRATELTRPGSAALVAATVATIRRRSGGTRTRRLVISMGVSRRPGTPMPAPDRDTAFVRLVADGVTDRDAAAELLATTAPEPAYPVGSGTGLVPRLVRLLGARLGATVLVSNLGRIDHEGLRALRFWPVPTGPAGTATGLATTGTTTTVTVRVRRDWFSPQAAAEILSVLVDELAAQ